MDMYYGHLERQRGMFYINEVLKIKSKNRDVISYLYDEKSRLKNKYGE